MTVLVEDPWNVDATEYPRTGTHAEQLKFLLNYAVLAPSGYNTQPWRFKVAGDEAELYADRTRALAVVDPQGRALILSCGAALFHLRTALRYYGYTPIVQVFPDFNDPDLLAFVRMGPRHEPTAMDQRLFEAIKKRRTNRLPFAPRPVPEADLQACRAAVQAEGAHLHVFREEEKRHALVDLIARGDRIQGCDKRFRRELAAWVHPNRSKSHDGMPGYALGVGTILSYTGPFVIRTFDWGEGQAAQDRQLADGSPMLLAITTAADNAMAWLEAGQALARFLLLAHDAGLSVSFLNQPIEVPALRPCVAALIEEAGHPQLILRLGYGQEIPPTPRRPVHEVLVNASFSMMYR